jgi:hypothetical protein
VIESSNLLHPYLTKDQERLAVQQVARHAADDEERDMFLFMLGLAK